MDKLRIKMQKGSVMVLFAVLLPIFVFFVSVVVDFARAHAHKAYLQNVADAAALAGVKTVVPTETARLVPDYPGDENDANLADASTNAKANSAADKSVESNGDSANPFTSVDKKLKKNGESYYYKVKIIEHVPLLVARAFLPNSVMPDGFPVEVVAWASIDSPSVEGNLFDQLNKIGIEQTIKDYKSLKAAGPGAGRVENVDRNNNDLHVPADVFLPKGIYFSKLDDKVVRTETVVPNKVNTWKYMFVEFQPDIQINKNKGILKDGNLYFPLDNWDLGIELTPEQWNIVEYGSIVGLNGSGRKRDEVIKRIRDTFGISIEEATEVLLESPITNVVSFSALHTVRGDPLISTIPESDKTRRRKALEKWENKTKNGGEVKILNYAHEHGLANEDDYSLADLVVRSTKINPEEANNPKVNKRYYMSADDPLLVRIESEDINKVPTGNNNVFYASSTRKLTLKIDADNTDDLYRPLIIYYYGPEDFDGNTGDNQTGVKRESRLVTLELNADFKGILFAPNSPVTIKANGHRIRGIVVAKSYCYEDGTPIGTNDFIYTKYGFDKNNNDQRLRFDDFDMLALSEDFYKYQNVILTSVQAKFLK